MNGVWIHMAAIKLKILRLALDPGISLLTSLCFSTFATPIFVDPAVLCAVSKHNKEDLSVNMTKLSVPRNVARDHAPGRLDVRTDSRFFVVSWLLPFYISESRFCDPVVHAVYSVPSVLLLVFWYQDDHSSRNSLMMKERSYGPYSSKVVTSRFALYSGIAVETFTDPCDFQDLHHIWAIQQANGS